MAWTRFLCSGTLAATAAFFSLTAIPVAGQAPKPSAKTYAPPRVADGHPDLQGTYDLGTLTPLERPAGAKPVLTREGRKNWKARSKRGGSG